jgi:threonine synthase
MGIEIVDQVKDVDAVIVPVGRAGLIAGVSLAVKATRTRSRIRELGCLNRQRFVHGGNAEPRGFRATSRTIESARRRNLRREIGGRGG